MRRKQPFVSWHYVFNFEYVQYDAGEAFAYSAFQAGVASWYGVIMHTVLITSFIYS